MQTAMDNVTFVKIFETLKELTDKVASDGFRKLLEFGEEGKDTPSWHVFHEDVETFILFLTSHVLNDVGMIEISHYLDLFLDSKQLITTLCQSSKRHLKVIKTTRKKESKREKANSLIVE